MKRDAFPLPLGSTLENLLSVIGKIVLLLRRKSTSIRHRVEPPKRHGGYYLGADCDDRPIICKANVTAIEQAIYMRRQQQPVVPIKTLLVRGVFPWLDVAGHQ